MCARAGPHRRGRRLRGAAAQHRRTDRGRSHSRRPQDRPDLSGGPAAARRGPAGLRGAARRHGVQGRRRTAGLRAAAAEGRGGAGVRAESGPHRRAVRRADRRQRRRPRQGLAGDRGQPDQRLGHHLRRHGRRQRLVGAVRPRHRAGGSGRDRAEDRVDGAQRQRRGTLGGDRCRVPGRPADRAGLARHDRRGPRRSVEGGRRRAQRRARPDGGVQADDQVEATITGLGTVRATFAKQEA